MQIVDRSAYLLALSRYVVMNTVRAGLVERPEQWPWSSYAATAGLAPPPSFLAISSTLQLFGSGDYQDLRNAFVRFIDSAMEDEATGDRLRSAEAIVGSRAFKDWVASAANPIGPGQGTE